MCLKMGKKQVSAHLSGLYSILFINPARKVIIDKKFRQENFRTSEPPPTSDHEPKNIEERILGKYFLYVYIYMCVCVLLIRIHVCVCVCVCVRVFACNYL